MSIGIDGPASLSGFTIRELLIEAANIATGEDIPAIKAKAFEMRAVFGAPGLPSLSAEQVAAYTDMISLASEYQAVAMTEEPDGFAPEDEHRAYAVATHVDDLMHAVRWLGSR